MRSIHGGRAAPLALVLVAALCSSGCPELNRQAAPKQDPLFSVDDPAGRDVAAWAAARGIEQENRGSQVKSEEGGLPDQSRRAQ